MGFESGSKIRVLLCYCVSVCLCVSAENAPSRLTGDGLSSGRRAGTGAAPMLAGRRVGLRASRRPSTIAPSILASVLALVRQCPSPSLLVSVPVLVS